MSDCVDLERYLCFLLACCHAIKPGRGMGQFKDAHASIVNEDEDGVLAKGSNTQKPLVELASPTASIRPLLSPAPAVYFPK